MSVLSVLTRSMREMFWPRRFLPFFLLYMLFTLSAYLALTPILALATGVNIAWMATMAVWGIVVLIVIFIGCALTHLWFTGALIWDAKCNCGFSKALKHSRGVYLQMFLVLFVMLCLVGLTMFFQDFSLILQFLIGWVFLFSLPAVVINGYKFEIGLKRSYEIVRSKAIQTLVFFVLRNIVLFAIMIAGLIVVTLSLAPVILGSIPVNQLQYLSSSSDLAESMALQFMANILNNYPYVLISSIFVAFFGAIFQVFDSLSRTYYYLEVGKVARRKRKR